MEQSQITNSTALNSNADITRDESGFNNKSMMDKSILPDITSESVEESESLGNQNDCIL